MLPEDPEAFRRIGSSASSTSAAENISNATDLERLSAALDSVNGWDYEPEQTVAMRCARAHVGEGPYRLDQVRVCARPLSRPAPLGYSPGATRWRLAVSAGHPLRGCHQRVGCRAASRPADLHHGILSRQGRGRARARRAGGAGQADSDRGHARHREDQRHGATQGRGDWQVAVFGDSRL